MIVIKGTIVDNEFIDNLGRLEENKNLRKH
jgi:hypothetical protein